jgi:Outer membrane protein beta-barrel domain
VEADLNYSGQRAKMRARCPGEVCNPALVGVVSDPSVLALSDQGQKLEWFATLRGRLGATVTPGALAYVTGGLAVGEIMTAGTVFGFDGDGDGNPVNTIVSSHNTKAGCTVGGGIEGRLAGNWTAKLEYLYLDLGTVSTVPTPAANATVATAFNSRVTDNIVRATSSIPLRAAGPTIDRPEPTTRGRRANTRARRRRYSRRNGSIASKTAPGNSSCTESFPRGSVMLRMPGMAASASISARDRGGVSAP